MKTCTQCKETKPADTEHYYQYKNGKFHAACKACEKERARKYKYEHKERAHELYKKYYAEDRERYLENSRRWKSDNKEKNAEYLRNFRLTDSGQEKLRGYRQNRKKKTPEVKQDQWVMCLTYFNHSCAYCGMSDEEAKSRFGDGLHKEHLINDGRNDLKNIVPSCKSCNSEKGTRTFNDWYSKDNPRHSVDRYMRIYYWIRYFSKAVV